MLFDLNSILREREIVRRAMSLEKVHVGIIKVVHPCQLITPIDIVTAQVTVHSALF